MLRYDGLPCDVLHKRVRMSLRGLKALRPSLASSQVTSNVNRSFPTRQPISTREPQSRKQARIPLRTSWLCPPRLIIIQYSCFDYRTNLSHVLAAWSALFTWSLCTTCAKDHRIVVFYAISELPFASASKRVLVQSLLHENFIRTSSLVHWHVNKTNFHRYSFAPELALKQRRKVRKWPVTYKSTSLEYPIVCLLH